MDELINNKRQILLFSALMTKCHSCSINHNCQFFKEIFEKCRKEAEDELKIHSRAIMNNGAWDELGKAIELEKLEGRIKGVLREKLKRYGNICLFEENAVGSIYEGLNAKYNLEENYNLIPLVEQIVKLKIYDIRLMVEHSKGLFVRGEKGVRMAPGVHYSLEISEKITEMLDKIDKIYNQHGEATINVAIINASELFGSIDKPTKIDIKRIEDG